MALSKSAVNRAGDLLREWWIAGLRDEHAEDPPGLDGAILTMDAWRRRHQQPMTKVRRSVKRYMQTEGIPDTATGRLKRAPTILDKLRRISGMNLSRMHDIGGVRAIVPSGDVGSIARLQRRIARGVNEVIDVDDYITAPKATGYRAVHVIVRRDGYLVEIQLRTEPQHNWADFVETLSGRTGLQLKDGQGPDELLDYLKAGADIIALLEEGRGVDEPTWARFDALKEEVAPFLAGREEE